MRYKKELDCLYYKNTGKAFIFIFAILRVCYIKIFRQLLNSIVFILFCACAWNSSAKSSAQPSTVENQTQSRERLLCWIGLLVYWFTGDYLLGAPTGWVFVFLSPLRKYFTDLAALLMRF